MKYCSGCKTDKPETDFWKNASAKDGLQAWCKSCWVATTAKRRNGPKRDIELRQRRNRHLIRKYGITADEYDERLRKQMDVCGICKGTTDSHLYMAVDHDHETGQIRGILCENCNRGIGMFKHNPILLQNAIDYLNQW